MKKKYLHWKKQSIKISKYKLNWIKQSSNHTWEKNYITVIELLTVHCKQRSGNQPFIKKDDNR